MKHLTPELLRKIAPNVTKANAEKFAPVIDLYSEQYEVNTPVRMAAFLSQILEETGSLRWLKEIWGNTPAQRRYDPPGKKARDLGNDEVGDGKRYLGRGLIQTTGQSNYLKASIFLFGDARLLIKPELLELPDNAVRSAYFYWHKNNLNKLADLVPKAKTVYEGLKAVTKRVNGGLTHHSNRVAFYNSAIKHLT